MWGYWTRGRGGGGGEFPSGLGGGGEEVAEEDSVAVEEHAGGGFVGCVGSAGLFDGGLAEVLFPFSRVRWRSNPCLRSETWGTRIRDWFGFVEEGPAAG